MIENIIIVGAGLCGARAALALREKGFSGAVTLIGDEDQHPYDRPPLSKAFLTDNDPIQWIAPQQTYAEQSIVLRSGQSAKSIDRANKQVFLANGESIGYDRLLLATGASPRSLAMAPKSDRILTLRSIKDAKAIKSLTGVGKKAIIIGGGFIGLELASSFCKLGMKVDLIEGLPRLMARAVPAEIAAILEAKHRESGVRFHLGVSIAKISEIDTGVRCTLADGTDLEADFMVIGIGAIPNVKLAVDAGLDVNNGIVVDQNLTTYDPAIFAAGDCCSFKSTFYGDQPIRLESWRNAQDQGIQAAAAMLGEPVSSDTLPWFWSDQCDMSLQVIGLANPQNETVIRQLGADSILVFNLSSEGRLVSASGVGPGNSIARDIRLCEMLIRNGVALSAAQLVDGSVKLKSLV